MIFEDSILVTYLRSGEPQRVKAAWAAWYDRDVGAVRRALRRAARQGVDIEGFSHDAFVVAVRGIQSSRFRYRQGKLRRYVCVIALNLLRAEWRGRASSEIPLTALSRHDEGQAAEWVAEPTVAGPEAAVEQRQFEQWLAGRVRAGLAELALEERRLLLAYHLDG
ncbi:MAG TPA: hypothetical protein DEP84_01550, partial [Chloroflexi bacterium]|nr:hypothetical protein [Chloroflexota bacterium]